VAVAVATVSTYFILRYGQRIIRALGKIGVVAITRVMGLLLAAVAVQFILNGLIALAPQL
jgi:multiple antibiotic resistance protein